MASMGSLYCPQLTNDTKTELRSRLYSYQRSKIKAVLHSLNSHSSALRNILDPDWSSTVDLLVRDFLQLFSVNPSTASTICHHWSTIFVLTLLVDELQHLRRPYRIKCLITCLSAIMIRLRLYHSSVIYATADYRTIDSIYCFFSDQAIVNSNGTPFSHELIWHFDHTTVTICTAASKHQISKFSIPIEADSPVQLVSLTKVVHFDSISIDGDNPLSKGYHFDETVEAVEPAGWTPLSISQSVDAVYPLLARFWPETIDWLTLLVPAFVDRAGVAHRHKASSYTWGPGTPIFLSRVEHPMYLASVIIHELQHQRYLLFASADDFLLSTPSERPFISLWRTDPRPLIGLMLGLHAFLAENEFTLRILPFSELSHDLLLDNLFFNHRKNLFAFRTLLDFEPTMSFTEKRLLLEMGHTLLDQHTSIEQQASMDQRRRFNAWLDGHISTVCSLSPRLANVSGRYRDWDAIIGIATKYVRVNGECKCE